MRQAIALGALSFVCVTVLASDGSAGLRKPVTRKPSPEATSQPLNAPTKRKSTQEAAAERRAASDALEGTRAPKADKWDVSDRRRIDVDPPHRRVEIPDRNVRIRKEETSPRVRPFSSKLELRDEFPSLSEQLRLGKSRGLGEEEAKVVLHIAGPYDVLATFQDRKVAEFTLTHAALLFRIHGEQSAPSPWLMCCEKIEGPDRTMDATGRALWPGNTQEWLTTVLVPKGTKIYHGIAADQVYDYGGKRTFRKGGQQQIFMPEAAEPEQRLLRAKAVRHEYRLRRGEVPVVPRSSDGDRQKPVKVYVDKPDSPSELWFDPVSKRWVFLPLNRAA